MLCRPITLHPNKSGSASHNPVRRGGSAKTAKILISMTCCRLVDLIYAIYAAGSTPIPRQFHTNLIHASFALISNQFLADLTPRAYSVLISLLSRASHLFRSCSYFSEAFFFRAKIRTAAMISASAAMPANSAMFMPSPVSGFGSPFSIGYSSTMNCQSSAPMLS